MSDWTFLNKHRCRVETPTVPRLFISDDANGFNGMFRIPMNGETLRVVAADGGGWQHVSVSIEYDPRCPKWEIMCKVKDLFWEPEDVVVQFHPKKSEYVNMVKSCLHLWRCLDRDFPTPPPSFVGIK